MRVNTNFMALNAWRSLNNNSVNQQKSLEKLSSGYRINRAGDDAAGLTVSEKMRAQIRGTNMAVRNAQDGISVIQTAEGGAGQVQNMVQRMRELAVQASSDSLTDTDRGQLDKEFQALKTEVTRTAQSTTFNGKKLLDSSATGTATATAQTTAAKIKVSVADPSKVAVADTYSLVYTKDGGTPGQGEIQIQDGVGQTVGTINHGANDKFEVNGVTIDATNFDWSSAALTGGSVTTTKYDPASNNTFSLQIGANNGDTLSVKMANLTSTALKLDGPGVTNVDVTNRTNSENVINTLDTALETINSSRADLGAYQNRLENAIGTLQVQAENLTGAESRIRDVDMAAEMSQFTKFQILVQAGTAMMAQANQAPQAIVSLLR